MAENRRKRHSNGPSKWARHGQNVHGPGIWATCVKGKEKQTVGELYDLFDSLAEKLWPVARGGVDDDEIPSDEEDVEKAFAKEIAIIKQPRKEKRFANCQTDTPCAIYISCKPPVDPVLLIQTHVQNVEKTGVTRTRSTHRLIPIADTCDVNAQDITSLCKRVVVPSFETEETHVLRYKIDLRIRNHNTLTREDIILTIAKCIPAHHKVDLVDPEMFILVEVFKSVCGMSVVRDYHRYKKFNVIEIAQSRNGETEGVPDKK
ncbi:hypothetical protein BD410DRAFT_617007 [Rickenella mellea]|uniref:THUMP domain-containing protein n=1 Tax=Rickenella mellea TaxID=50990 RepID=A0A4Y7PMB6_9AGAM|nr:hypothetical protein BD410DRAFT_617007 [Rickenella mellea]